MHLIPPPHISPKTHPVLDKSNTSSIYFSWNTYTSCALHSTRSAPWIGSARMGEYLTRQVEQQMGWYAQLEYWIYRKKTYEKQSYILMVDFILKIGTDETRHNIKGAFFFLTPPKWMRDSTRNMKTKRKYRRWINHNYFK